MVICNLTIPAREIPVTTHILQGNVSSDNARMLVLHRFLLGSVSFFRPKHCSACNFPNQKNN